MAERPVFNVAQLLKEPIGATRNVRVDADLQELAPDVKLISNPDEPQATLSGPVHLMRVTNGVLAQGIVSAEVTLPCVRCLEPVRLPLEIGIEETFEPTVDIVTGQSVTPEDEDRAVWIDAHHILDLSEVLRQDILVAIPVHVVCSEECRGLCPTCGKNLNEGDCDCKAEPDPRWAALHDLWQQEENNHHPAGKGRPAGD